MTEPIVTPLIPPAPIAVRGVAAPKIDLNDRTGNGTWRFLFASPDGVPAPDAPCQDLAPDALRAILRE